MKIALIGYGKMGHIIENIAKERGHEIVCIIDQHNLEDFSSEAFRSADVAIEFTIPTSAEGNVLKCSRLWCRSLQPPLPRNISIRSLPRSWG